MKALWLTIATILCWNGVTFAIPGEADLVAFFKFFDANSISIGKLRRVNDAVAIYLVRRTDFKGQEEVRGWQIDEAGAGQRPAKIESSIFQATRQDDRTSVTANGACSPKDLGGISSQFTDHWPRNFAGNLQFASGAMADVSERHLDNQPRYAGLFVGRVGHKVKVWNARWVDETNALNRNPSPPTGLAYLIGLKSGPRSPLSLDQRSINEPYPATRQEKLSQSQEEKRWGPVGYCLLGCGIALICAGWFAIIRGFKRAGDAMDVALDGQGKAWWCVSLWLLIALGGALLAAGVVTYALSLYLSA
jgi:hypothetical protein